MLKPCPPYFVGCLHACLRQNKAIYLPNLTQYDHALEDAAGKPGVDEVAQLIRAKVHSAIANVYPQLKAECQRQSQMRCDKKIKNQ